MRFTIDSSVPALAPSPEFFSGLLLSVTAGLSTTALSLQQGRVLCEYLDCLDARVAGLSKKHRAAARARLTKYWEHEADCETRCSLAKCSPSARALLAKAFAPACSPTSQRPLATLTYLFPLAANQAVRARLA